MKTLAITLFFAFSSFVYSQTNSVTFYGYIKDSETGESLIGATVYEKNSGKGTVSNNFGFYSLTIPEYQEIIISISYVGYKQQTKHFISPKSKKQDFFLVFGNQLNEVVVVASKEKPIEKRKEMSTVKIPVRDISKLPALGGESDIIKAIQLMPGVQSGNEGSSNLYVRGGSPDQNLILLDDVPLYYVNHLGGFVSIFNTDAINSIKLIKGGFPARYGSRLSSVLDIRMKDGNKKEFHGSGMVGVIASKISLEGNLKKDTTSYIISGRRMLLDLVMKPISRIVFDGFGFGYHFYDFNAKINHKLTEKDRLFFSFYTGDDIFSSKIKDNDKTGKIIMRSRNKWGNNLLAFRWNHIYNQKLFSNVTLSYTRYRYLIDFSYEEKEDEKRVSSNYFKSGIYDTGLKADWEYFAGSGYKLLFGLSGIYHVFSPGIHTTQVTKGSQTLVNNTKGQTYRKKVFESAAYVENEIDINNRFSVNAGIRINSYATKPANYYSIEPRIILNYLITGNLSMKTSYARMNQNIHLLTGTGMGMPVNLWLPATQIAQPELSHQWAIGTAKSLKNGVYELSIEAYYKKMQNMIAYKEGATYLNASESEWEKNIETDGKGQSYGIEFLLQKKKGNTTGWLGYTWAKTNRQFANINSGKKYPYKYDRRNDISLVIIHKINKNTDISATWVYGTGNPYTLAAGKYDIIGRIRDYSFGEQDNYELVEIYSGRNNYRMRDYHRLDIGANFHKKKKWGERIWNVSIYNLYSRQNPYYYFFEKEFDYDDTGNKIENSGHLVLKQMSLFPFIPSISYSFKF